jgi:Planctomycete cytochrome C
LKPFDILGVLSSNRVLKQAQFFTIMNKTIALALASIFGLAAAVLADDSKTAASTASMPPASTKTGVTFATDIKPIFDAACVKCHDGTKKPRAGLALDTLEGTLKGSRDGSVVKVGDSAHSDLVLSVAHIGDPDSFMPKGKGAQKLTDEQIGLIRAWIDQGAK